MRMALYESVAAAEGPLTPELVGLVVERTLLAMDGHLEEPERSVFLREARRVAPELVVVDSALTNDAQPVEWQERVLTDGSRWQVYKRFFEAEELAEELGGGRTLFAGRWFVAVQT